MKAFLHYIALICLCVNTTSSSAMLCCENNQPISPAMNEALVDKEKPPCHETTSHETIADETIADETTADTLDAIPLIQVSLSDENACCDCFDCVQLNSIVFESSIFSSILSTLNQPQHIHTLGLTIKLIFDPPILIS